METARPKLSVIIPAYNEEKFIADCLRSLAKQKTTFPYEVIIVDNNSSDATAAIATHLGARVVKEKQPGVCYARQAGLEAARGDIIVSTDADTTYAPTWLQKIHDAFDSPEVVGVTGAIRFVHEPPFWSVLWARTLALFMFMSYKLSGSTAYMSACNSAYRKKAFPGYETNLTQGGDELYVVRQLKKVGKVRFVQNNPVYTSSRRNIRGFLYNAFVMILVYYVIEYFLSRLLGRPVFGSYPAFRDEKEPRFLKIFHMLSVIIIIVLAMLYTPPGHYLYHKANHIYREYKPSIQKRTKDLL